MAESQTSTDENMLTVHRLEKKKIKNTSDPREEETEMPIKSSFFTRIKKTLQYSNLKANITSHSLVKNGKRYPVIQTTVSSTETKL